MSNVQPISRDAVGPLAPIFDAAEQAAGFVSNSMLTMATQLAQPAVDFAADALGAAGWVLGKHGS